ncbi:MAG: hypothetical protein ACM3O7_11365 [Acidobacteriota bacterium]
MRTVAVALLRGVPGSEHDASRPGARGGPYSGASNVELWLLLDVYRSSPEVVGRIPAVAKRCERGLTDAELRESAVAGGRATAGE